MKLKIINYNIRYDYCECRDENGEKHFVDIISDGGLKIETEDDLKELIGKEIFCDSLTPFLKIANNVKFKQ